MNMRDGEASVLRLVVVSIVISLAALMSAAWLARRQRRRAGLGD
jgi:HAMP domain-containing protein